MDQVRRLAADSPYADRFSWVGYVEAVEPLYAAMDIVVHASAMGTSGYAEARVRFDAPVVAGQLLGAYWSAVGQPG